MTGGPAGAKEKQMKRIFLDILTDIKKPKNLWKFVVLSLCVHVIVAYGFVTLPVAGDPTAVARMHKKAASDSDSPSQPLPTWKRESFRDFADRKAKERKALEKPAVLTHSARPTPRPDQTTPIDLDKLQARARAVSNRRYTSPRPAVGTATRHTNASPRTAPQANGSNIPGSGHTSTSPSTLTYSGSSPVYASNAQLPPNSRSNTTPNTTAQPASQSTPQPGGEQHITTTGKPTPAYTYSHRPRRGLASRINSDEYLQLYQKPFQPTLEAPDFTFPLKVGTLSFPSVRRSIKKLELPEEEEVKIEELINYFHYNYPEPEGPDLIAVVAEIGPCPWNPSNRLLHVGLKGKTVFGDGFKDSQFRLAEDVKTMVTFNPVTVKGYRLIGYGKRTPKVGRWEHDGREGGVLRAGQRITTLYEVIPETAPVTGDDGGKELATITVRYREPNIAAIREITYYAMEAEAETVTDGSESYRFSAAAAQFGMMLKNEKPNKEADIDALIQSAKQATGDDPYGYRATFIHLLGLYKKIRKDSK